MVQMIGAEINEELRFEAEMKKNGYLVAGSELKKSEYTVAGGEAKKIEDAPKEGGGKV